MTALIVTIHVIVSIALILIVLLQTGKGADMGAVFGGAGSQALFGTTGAATFLGKMTTVAAVVFMITSLSLAYLSKSGGESVVSDIKPAAQQSQPSAPALPAQQTTPAGEDNIPAVDAESAPIESPAETMPEAVMTDDASAIPDEASSPAPQDETPPTAD
jgi:preprotein translocase subunit SecG